MSCDFCQAPSIAARLRLMESAYHEDMAEVYDRLDLIEKAEPVTVQVNEIKESFMSPEIAELVNKAKTCAPAKCGSEAICFKLALEVERLCGVTAPTEPSTEAPVPEAPITPQIPGYEMQIPFWGMAHLDGVLE